MQTLNSHTHCQVALAALQSKTWQKVCLFPTQGRKYIAANLTTKRRQKIQRQCTTRVVAHFERKYGSILRLFEP